MVYETGDDWRQDPHRLNASSLQAESETGERYIVGDVDFETFLIIHRTHVSFSRVSSPYYIDLYFSRRSSSRRFIVSEGASSP